MTKELKEIEGIFGLDGCYVTEDGEIYKRMPTQHTKDGVEIITRNFSSFKVQDIADRAFGKIDKLNKFKR